MKTEIKNEIKKIVKRNGSHLGVVKHIINTNFDGVNFEDYKEFTNNLITKKIQNTESKIRASVRYQ